MQLPEQMWACEASERLTQKGNLMLAFSLAKMCWHLAEWNEVKHGLS